MAIGKASRRDMLKLSGAGVGGAAVALLAGEGSAQANEPGFGPAQLLGSWHVQVAFNSGPQAGRVEQTLVTFSDGGGIVESDGTGTWAHAGRWEHLGGRSYQFTLVEFTYDPATTHVTQVVVPHVFFDLARDGQALASTSDETRVYIYDPASGALVTTITLPNVSRVTGVRIGTSYVPPHKFPV